MVIEAKTFLRLASFFSQTEILDAPVESVCLSVCLSVSSTGKFNWPSNKKNKTSPTVILSSLASSIGNLLNKTKSDRKSLLTLFSLQQENWSYADAAVFISVQTGQNLHESISTFYKSHPHLRECFLTSHAKQVLARFGFRGKSFFSLHPVRVPSMGEIKLFNHLLRIILFSCMWIINIT